MSSVKKQLAKKQQDLVDRAKKDVLLIAQGAKNGAIFNNFTKLDYDKKLLWHIVNNLVAERRLIAKMEPKYSNMPLSHYIKKYYYNPNYKGEKDDN